MEARATKRSAQAAAQAVCALRSTALVADGALGARSAGSILLPADGGNGAFAADSEIARVT